ncbi:MAG: hypothetical protein GXC72_08610 [Chitinophagaceae bacterium]|jgi:hypothetical protein|nr:hypothetical protein [Chitinophagaceae bacterium]
MRKNILILLLVFMVARLTAQDFPCNDLKRVAGATANKQWETLDAGKLEKSLIDGSPSFRKSTIQLPGALETRLYLPGAKGARIFSWEALYNQYATDSTANSNLFDQMAAELKQCFPDLTWNYRPIPSLRYRRWIAPLTDKVTMTLNAFYADQRKGWQVNILINN